MKVDVAIIGAGPGGAMAAWRLARSGLKVMILDKDRLPRVKACGGAVPVKIQDLFDGDVTPPIEARVTTVKYLYDYGRINVLAGLSPPLLMVDRSTFDFYLLEQALAAGKGSVNLRDGWRVEQVEETPDKVFIKNDKQGTVQADFVIAADGAFSKTAMCLGLNENAPSGLAIDARVDVSTEVYEALKNCATINFGCLPGGYGWIFPKSSYLSCGLGSWHKGGGGRGLVRNLEDFLAKSFPAQSIRAVKQSVHPVPIYGGHRSIATRRVCLVGDAANLVDPVMGEGIRFAIRSGAIAADVIIGLMGANPVDDADAAVSSAFRDLGRAYQQLIHKGIGADLDILYRLALPVFLEAPLFAYQKFFLEGHSYLNLSRNLARQMKLV